MALAPVGGGAPAAAPAAYGGQSTYGGQGEARYYLQYWDPAAGWLTVRVPGGGPRGNPLDFAPVRAEAVRLVIEDPAGALRVAEFRARQVGRTSALEALSARLDQVAARLQEQSARLGQVAAALDRQGQALGAQAAGLRPGYG